MYVMKTRCSTIVNKTKTKSRKKTIGRDEHLKFSYDIMTALTIAH